MTSGTTGRPKGIVHSMRSLLARVSLNVAEIGSFTLRESLCVLPVFFGHGLIGNVLTPLLAGGRVHLWQNPDLKALGTLGEVLDERGISFMSSVPSFWKIALRVSPRPRRVLDRIHVGSAPLSIEQWRAIAEWSGTESVFNMLGMTETANWIGGGSLRDAGDRDGYVGAAWGGALAVLGEDGRVQRSGRGEVLVQTPALMLGYWERPDLDDTAYLDGWFRTGDVGEIDADGRLTLIGRLKSEINRGGIKIQAEEIDMLLERHPDIVEACAFGIPDAMAGEAVAAAVVMKPDAEFNADRLKQWCRERVRAEAVPARLWRVDAIPEERSRQGGPSRRSCSCRGELMGAKHTDHSPLRGTFETARFTLRSLNMLEAFQITNSWRKDPDILKGLFQSSRPKNLYQWYLGGPIPRSPKRFVYSITPKGSSQPIGVNTFKLSGYRSAFGSIALHDRSWWGRDVVVEARAELMNQFFRHTNVERFYGVVDARNVSSIFSYRKLGFSHNGTWHRCRQDPSTGEVFDLVTFEIFLDQWKSGRYWDPKHEQ